MIHIGTELFITLKIWEVLKMDRKWARGPIHWMEYEVLRYSTLEPNGKHIKNLRNQGKKWIAMPPGQRWIDN